MDAPRVTIIITNYNYGDYVINALESALNQDYKGPLRVVLLDDGSTDGSWEKLQEFSNQPPVMDSIQAPYYSGHAWTISDSKNDRKFDLINIKNSGASTARNVAMWYAWEDTDVFGVLDADDEYYPHKVSKMIPKLTEYPEIGAVYGDYDIHKTYGNCDHMKYEHKEAYDKNLLQRRCIVHSGSLIKRAYLQQILLPNQEIFDSNLHGPASQGFIGCTEDYDLWLRLSNFCIIEHIPEALSLVRETGANQSMRMNPQIFQQNVQTMQRRNGQ